MTASRVELSIHPEQIDESELHGGFQHSKLFGLKSVCLLMYSSDCNLMLVFGSIPQIIHLFSLFIKEQWLF